MASSVTYPVLPKGQALENEMRSQAGDIARQEEQRYQSGLGLLNTAYHDSQKSLSSLIDPSLLFSKASDAIGARGVANMNTLRSSLGARGLNPNSGAASGLLSRMAFENNNAVVGATRDVALENQRQRQVNAAQSFANALNLANFTNSPVSGVQLETTQNLFEGQLAREGIAAQERSNKRANKSNKASGVGGAIGGIAKGLIPGL